MSLKKGNYSKIKPNREDLGDIRKAISTLNKLGKYNYSQGVVVRNKKVIAIEGSVGSEWRLWCLLENTLSSKVQLRLYSLFQM